MKLKRFDSPLSEKIKPLQLEPVHKNYGRLLFINVRGVTEVPLRPIYLYTPPVVVGSFQDLNSSRVAVLRFVFLCCLSAPIDASIFSLVAVSLVAFVASSP